MMKISILISDDHAMFRSGQKELISKEDDMEVVGETGSGHKTLRFLDSTEVDVVLLDINMPGLNGTQIAGLALKQHPELLIIALTMHEDEHDVQELFKTGVKQVSISR